MDLTAQRSQPQPDRLQTMSTIETASASISDPSGDFLGRIPPELLLHLMKLSAGLSSLRSLIYASPDCYRLFDSWSIEIIEAVMAATVPASIRCRMRANLRWELLGGPKTLDEAKSVPCITSINSTPLRSDDMQLLPSSLSARRFLNLAHRIHMLGHACLDHYIQSSLAMCPSYLVKLGPLQRGLGRRRFRVLFDTAKGQPFRPSSTGPPSWVEEQRVLKALWLIQYHLRLENALAANLLSWPQDDQQALASAGITRFFSNFPHSYHSRRNGFVEEVVLIDESIRHYEKQQIWTVREFVEMKLSEDGTLTKAELPLVSMGGFKPGECALSKVVSPNEDKFQQSSFYLDQDSASIDFQRWISQYPGESPLPYIPFDPWRKFGLAIFDDMRMIDLGLLRVWPTGMPPKRDLYYTWYSVLTEEEKNLSGTSGIFT